MATRVRTRRPPRSRSQLEHEGFGASDPESGRAQGNRPPRPRNRPPRGTSQDPAVTRPRASDYRRGGPLNNPRTTVPSTRSPTSSSTSSSPGRSSQRASSTTRAGGDVAGVILTVLGYALVLNYLEGGPAQVRGWLSAKFLNKPYQSTASAPAVPATPTAPSGPPPAATARAAVPRAPYPVMA